MDSGTPDRLYFSTDALPERDRFPAFCEEFVRRRTALDIVRRSETAFRGVMDLRRAGPVIVGSHFSRPIDLVRSSRLVRDGDDSLLLALCCSGIACLKQRGTERKIEPGGSFICDSGYTGEVHLTADTLLSLVRIPRAALTKLLPRAERAVNEGLDRNDVLRRLLFGYLGVILDVRWNNDGRAMQLAGEHILDLIALALGADGEVGRSAQARGGRAARLQAILHTIERRSGDPGLSAAAIAATLGVTPRYVHLLLEETGKSFTHHVLEQRLQKAATLLREPRWRGRRIADVALTAGFTDLSYFSRAFRRRYGATPSDVRQAAVGKQPPLS
jgi:AraC-like DNA-binding protein